MRVQGSYSLIQFSVAPDRMEFLNVGVIVAVPETAFVAVRFAEDHPRIERLFGRSALVRLQDLKPGFALRVEAEFVRGGSQGFSGFLGRRANELRATPLLPVVVDPLDPEPTVDQLFAELVGEDERSRRGPRMASRLRTAFDKAGVFGMLDPRPAAVELPEGITVQTPFAYQNGAYNMIDGLQLNRDPKAAMREVGLRAFEGARLWKHTSKSEHPTRLVAVADVGEQSEEFYEAVQEELYRNDVRLYRLDQLGPLIEDIEANSLAHGQPEPTM